jgi:hypothetical protein
VLKTTLILANASNVGFVDAYLWACVPLRIVRDPLSFHLLELADVSLGGPLHELRESLIVKGRTSSTTIIA